MLKALAKASLHTTHVSHTVKYAHGVTPHTLFLFLSQRIIPCVIGQKYTDTAAFYVYFVLLDLSTLLLAKKPPGLLHPVQICGSHNISTLFAFPPPHPNPHFSFSAAEATRKPSAKSAAKARFSPLASLLPVYGNRIKQNIYTPYPLTFP